MFVHAKCQAGMVLLGATYRPYVRVVSAATHSTARRDTQQRQAERRGNEGRLLRMSTWKDKQPKIMGHYAPK